MVSSIPFYEESKDLIKLLKGFLGKRIREHTIAQFSKLHTALDNPHLYEFLRWKYDSEPTLERCGEIYPVVVYPAAEPQLQHPDSVLLNLDRQILRDKELSNPRFRKLLKRVGRRLEDRPTFTMRELN